MTKRERHWLGHVQAGEASAGSLAAYVREQGLKTKDLYQWKTRLRRRSLLTEPAQTPEPLPDNTGSGFRSCYRTSAGTNAVDGIEREALAHPLWKKSLRKLDQT